MSLGPKGSDGSLIRTGGPGGIILKNLVDSGGGKTEKVITEKGRKTLIRTWGSQGCYTGNVEQGGKEGHKRIIPGSQGGQFKITPRRYPRGTHKKKTWVTREATYKDKSLHQGGKVHESNKRVVCHRVQNKKVEGTNR